MKLGINFKTGHRWSLTSWISREVPASGSFTYGGDPNGMSQLFIWWRGDVYWSSGLWHKGKFDNAPRLYYHDYHRFSYISNDDEKYLMYVVTENRTLARFTMDTFGTVQERGEVAPYGACSMSDNVEPGCTKEILPACRKGGYLYEQRQGYVFGESSKFNNMSLFDCQAKCTHNCSCAAFAAVNYIGTGCEIWSCKFSSNEREIYGREVYFLVSRRGKRKAEEKMLLYELGGSTNPPNKFSSSKNQRKDKKMSHSLNIFSFESIFTATSNFSISNKLGECGFGPVYKGKHDDGQEVAIKRL